MPKLTDIRQTRKVTLDDYEGAEVEVYTDLRPVDLKGLDLNAGSTGDVDTLLKLLPRYIKAWNFTDEDDSDLPITEESCGRLTVRAVRQISEAFEGKTAAEKK